MYRETRKDYTFTIQNGMYEGKTFTVTVVTEHKQSHGEEYRLRSIRSRELGCSRDYSEYVAANDLKAVAAFFYEHGIREYKAV